MKNKMTLEEMSKRDNEDINNMLKALPREELVRRAQAVRDMENRDKENNKRIKELMSRGVKLEIARAMILG